MSQDLVSDTIKINKEEIKFPKWISGGLIPRMGSNFYKNKEQNLEISHSPQNL